MVLLIIPTKGTVWILFILNYLPLTKTHTVIKAGWQQSPRKNRFFISALSLFSLFIAGVRCRADALPPEPHPHLLANWVQRGRVWRHGVRARHPARGLRPHNPIQLHSQGYDASGQESKRKLAQTWSCRVTFLYVLCQCVPKSWITSLLHDISWDEAFSGRNVPWMIHAMGLSSQCHSSHP